MRLQKDRYIEKAGEFVENGTTKAKYKKTGIIMIWRSYAATLLHK